MGTAPAYLLRLGVVGYAEAWDLQRALAAAVSQGATPEVVVLLEHPPTVTLGRRTSSEELHLPADAEVDVVETDRGGRSTFHAPGQLVCYPILDLNRHGRDVKRYCRSLEGSVKLTLDAFGLPSESVDGLTGVWVPGEPRRKIASIGIHVSRWVTTHGYALNLNLDPRPFSQWITACGLEDAAFTTASLELGREVTVEETVPHAVAALGDVLGLAFEELPAEDGVGLWPQPVHAKMAV